MLISRLHFRGRSSAARGLIAALWGLACLALILQGAHVCASGESTDPGVWPASLSAPFFCPVCAIAHSLLVILLFFLIILVLTQARIILPAFQAKPCWRGLVLHVRPPPAF